MLSALENTFSVLEWFSLTGLALSLLVCVYIVLRARGWSRVAPALAYFGVLALSFALQFALRLEDYERPLRFALWACHAFGPPLCYLFVMQVAGGAPARGKQLLVLALPPFALVGALYLRRLVALDLLSLLYGFGGIAGGVALLALLFQPDLFAGLRKAREGRERYWLILVLVAMSVLAVGVSLAFALGTLEPAAADALMAVLGLAFIYLALTTLFRVYPPPLPLAETPTRFTSPTLSKEEAALAARAKHLLEVEKLYHEPSFNRAGLARELGVSENVLSRVINVAYGKGFPKVVNELRVEDAKRMLVDSSIPVQVVATEVGFNSLASFNRAFRELSGRTPTEYRESVRES